MIPYNISGIEYKRHTDICPLLNINKNIDITLPYQAAVKEVARLKSLDKIRGVILGTPGAGQGLDHTNVRMMLEAIEDAGLPIFLHPHYGVGVEHFTDR
jgi:predicted TIM-barrel fold metal-dependent hydrolase